MPGWVSYRRVGVRKAWEIGEYVARHHADGTLSQVWSPIAIRFTPWGREHLLKKLRHHSIHRYSYRPIRVQRRTARRAS